jgi:hypothetical protein
VVEQQQVAPPQQGQVDEVASPQSGVPPAQDWAGGSV